MAAKNSSSASKTKTKARAASVKSKAAPKKPTSKTPKAQNASASKEAPLITKGMTLGEVVQKYPQAAFVMMQYGLHCIGCHVSAWETVEQGAMGHGLSPKQVDEMVAQMNKVAKERSKPQKA